MNPMEEQLDYGFVELSLSLPDGSRLPRGCMRLNQEIAVFRSRPGTEMTPVQVAIYLVEE